jgi:hypothetical protein
MARHLVAASMLVSTLLGLGRPAEAQDMDGVSEDTLVAAREADVPVDKLLGAMASTQLPARQYLIGVGELPGPQPPPPSLGPPYGNAVARARCIIGKESGGADVPNARGSGATGPGQYLPATWQRHMALYRGATGYDGPLSLHVYGDVLAVMSWILGAMPGTRAEWAVGGC